MRFLAVWVADTTGRAVIGAKVALNEYSAITNDDGWVGLSIAPDIAGGQLVIGAEGYRTASWPVTLTPFTRDISVGPVPQTSRDPFFLPGMEPLVPALFPMRGATCFRLPQRREFMGEADGTEDVLHQLQQYGVTIIRELWMKTNNTGWNLRPSDWPDFFDRVKRHLDWLGRHGMRSMSCVFADTRFQMADREMQHEHWAKFVETVKPYGNMVVLQLVNEADNHQWSNLIPAEFSKPEGVVACHGTNGEDTDPPSPRWSLACYGARRHLAVAEDARPMTNCNPFEFQAVYPQPVPLIPVETWKAGEHYFEPEKASLMARHMALGWGGFYHTNAGIDARLFNTVEAACAKAFFGV